MSSDLWSSNERYTLAVKGCLFDDESGSLRKWAKHTKHECEQLHPVDTIIKKGGSNIERGKIRREYEATHVLAQADHLRVVKETRLNRTLDDAVLNLHST